MALFKQKRIYLDYASTTPVDKRVVAAMLPYFSTHFGNPSALYKEGTDAKQAVSEARTSIAGLLKARANEIMFTGSGTEADNMAIAGVLKSVRQTYLHTKLHIVTSTIEHPAILEVCKEMEKWGIEVSYVPVEENGIINPQKVAEVLRPETVLVSIMYANNEIGTIQPIKEISRVVKKFRESLKEKAGADSNANRNIRWPYVHTDASQAAGYFSCATDSLGVDMLTLDGSKIYGPKGIGALYVKKEVELAPLIVGGSQEDGKRAGTENVALIVGLAKAFEIAQAEREQESVRLSALRDYFIEELLTRFPQAHVNGDRVLRMPNNVNICFPKLNSEFAVIQLDEKGIACASVSSCKNLSDSSTSYVIEALGEAGNGCGESSLRFSLGRDTTKKDLQRVLQVLTSLHI